MLFLSPRVAGILTVLSFVVLHSLLLANATGLARQLVTIPSGSTTTTTSSLSSSSTPSTTTTTSTSSTSSTTSFSPLTPSPTTTTSDTTSTTSPSTSTSSSSSSSSSLTTSIPRTSSSTPPVQHTAFSSSYQYSTPTPDGTPTPTTNTTVGGSNTAGGNTGFLNNKAAVGGTFAAVGLVGAALIGSIIYLFVRRQRRLQDEDEVNAYFEKPSGAGRAGRSSTDLTFPLGSNTYHAHDIHYGATNVNYNDPHSYGMDYPPEASSFVDTRPVSVAPGTAYAAALSQQGPYQYNGQSVHDAPPAMGSNPHPFADPASGAGPSNDDAYAYDPFYARQ